MNDKQIDILIEYLKRKQVITDLEKDILDTWHEMKKMPFDRQSGEKKVIENNCKYLEIFKTISMDPGIEIRPFAQVTDEDIKRNLSMQLDLLLKKEMEEKR